MTFVFDFWIRSVQNGSNSGAPVGMWTWGRVHTKFWHVP